MPIEVQDKWDSAYAQRIAEYRKGDLKGKALISWKYQQYMRDYLATVLAVDENIGRLLNYLEKTGEVVTPHHLYFRPKALPWPEHGGLTNVSCMKNVSACRLSFAFQKQSKPEAPAMLSV